MIVPRQNLFSEEKEDKTSRIKIAAESGATLGGSGYLAHRLSKKESILDKSRENIMQRVTSAKTAEAIRNNPTHDKVLKGLMAEAKSQGTKIVTDNSSENAAFTQGGFGKLLRSSVAKVIKSIPKGSDTREKVLSGLHQGSDGVFRHLGKNRILLGGSGNLQTADVLSHEIGHSKYILPGQSKNLIGKASHTAMPVSSIAASQGVGKVASGVYGFKAGKDLVKKVNKGEKTSTWDKVKSVAAPSAVVAPLIIAEAMASKKGLSLMKKHGADKELLKLSKKRFGAALGTYGTLAAKPIVFGAGGQAAGMAYEGSKVGIEKLVNKRKGIHND